MDRQNAKVATTERHKHMQYITRQKDFEGRKRLQASCANFFELAVLLLFLLLLFYIPHVLKTVFPVNKLLFYKEKEIFEGKK